MHHKHYYYGKARQEELLRAAGMLDENEIQIRLHMRTNEPGLLARLLGRLTRKKEVHHPQPATKPEPRPLPGR